MQLSTGFLVCLWSKNLAVDCHCCSVDSALLIGFQIKGTDFVGVMSHPLFNLHREETWRGYLFPASVPLFSHANVGVALDPGHHLPFLGVWAPSSPDVSYCLCVSKQKVEDRRGSCGPKSCFFESTSLLFISLHVTEGGIRSRALCAQTSGESLTLLCSEGLLNDVMVSNRWLGNNWAGQHAFCVDFFMSKLYYWYCDWLQMIFILAPKNHA